MIPPARQSSCATLPDRRCATATLVAALTSGLAAVREPRLVRERFEEELRTLLSASSVTFREDGEPIDLRSGVVRSAGRARRRAAVPGGDLRSVASGRRLRAPHARRRRAARRADHRDRARERTLAAVRRAEPRRWRGAAHRIEPPRFASCATGSSSVAATDFTVLIEGESGTGKELVARQIHELSRRRRGPVRGRQLRGDRRDAARGRAVRHRGADGHRRARPPGQVRARGRRHAVSRRSLRPVAVRAGQAAARDSGPGGRAGRRHGRAPRRHPHRRRDEPARCRSWSSRPLPRRPLLPAERRRSARAAAARAPRRHPRAGAVLPGAPSRRSRPLQLSTAAADALLAYHWPGNVRELERVIERGVALARVGSLELDDLPPALRGGYADASCPSLRAAIESMRAWGSRYARLVLERCGNNKRQACRELRISLSHAAGVPALRPAKAHAPAGAAGGGGRDRLGWVRVRAASSGSPSCGEDAT